MGACTSTGGNTTDAGNTTATDGVIPTVGPGLAQPAGKRPTKAPRANAFETTAPAAAPAITSNGTAARANGIKPTAAAPAAGERPAWHPPPPVAAGTVPVVAAVDPSDPQSDIRAVWSSAAEAQSLVTRHSAGGASPVEFVRITLSYKELKPTLFNPSNGKEPFAFAAQIRRLKRADGKAAPKSKEFEPCADANSKSDDSDAGTSDWRGSDFKLNASGARPFRTLLIPMHQLCGKPNAGDATVIDQTSLIRIAFIGTKSTPAAAASGARSSAAAVVVAESSPMTVMGLLDCSGRSFSLFEPKPPAGAEGSAAASDDDDELPPESMRVGTVVIDDVSAVFDTTTAIVAPARARHTRLFAERTECVWRIASLHVKQLTKMSSLAANKPYLQIVDADDATGSGGGVVRFSTAVATNDCYGPASIAAATSGGVTPAVGRLIDSGSGGEWSDVYIPIESLAAGEYESKLVVRVMDKAGLIGADTVIGTSQPFTLRSILQAGAGAALRLSNPVHAAAATPTAPYTGSGEVAFGGCRVLSTSGELDRQASKAIKTGRWPAWDKPYRNLPAYCEKHVLYAHLLLAQNANAAAAAAPAAAAAAPLPAASA